MQPAERYPVLHYRPDIDGLRAIAILSVVAYHVGAPQISGGFVGVDVFFVISGYLITQILIGQLQATGRISIADFYVRRIRRLLPLLTLVVCATLVTAAVLLPPLASLKAMARSAFAATFFVANHYFVNNLGGYFDDASETLPLLHLWSLSVEEQFYLFYPLALLLIARAPKAMQFPLIRRGLIFVALFSFAASFYLVATSPIAGFYLLPSRAWELGVGALIAVTPPPRTTLTQIRGAGLHRDTLSHGSARLASSACSSRWFCWVRARRFLVLLRFPRCWAPLLSFGAGGSPPNRF